MQLKSVTDTLAPYGLSSPDLEMLRPDERRYTTLLMQPCGPICASEKRIGAFDQVKATTKGKEFLKTARDRGADLAVTPEYFLPWVTLSEGLAEGLIPPNDALWVLGTESITQEDLEIFKSQVSAHCIVIHEPFTGLSPSRHLLGTVALLFNAIRSDGTKQLVLLIQFKTYPSRDDLFFEESVLRRGSVVYQFKGIDSQLTAAVIICADALALAELKPNILNHFNHQSTLIHIQLNPNPRHSAFRKYRTTTFATDPRATNCHIICLNWAHSIVQCNDQGNVVEKWKNIAGSTWYCPAETRSEKDATVLSNHKNGLYYTYMTERRHALLFHYEEAVFELLVPKLFSLGSAVFANLNGPVAVNRYEWEKASEVWKIDVIPPETGFDNLIDKTPDARLALTNVLSENNAMNVERVLALSAGAITGVDDWFIAKNIDSCQIEKDEVINRVTVAQDNSSSAISFRDIRLKPITHIYHELINYDKWPPQVAGIDKDSTINWSKTSPNFNVLTSDEKPTLIVYLGDSPSADELSKKGDMFYDLLRKEGSPYQKRFCLIYRKYGVIQVASIPTMTRFDNPIENQTDITSVTPF